MMFNLGGFFAVLFLCMAATINAQSNDTYSADIVVYGATSAGVAAAVQWCFQPSNGKPSRLA